MKTQFYLLTTILVITLSALLMACEAAVPVTSNESADTITSDVVEPTQLKVLLLPYLSFAPFFIADAEGYFAEEGLEIEFVQMEDSGDAVPALIQGNLDVLGGLVTVGFLNGIARGSDIKIVADKGYNATDGCIAEGIIARPELEMGDVTDMAGKRISINAASVEGYLVETLLATADLSVADIELDDISPPAELGALQQGTIDMISVSEPWVTRVVDAGAGTVWKSMGEIEPDFQWAIIAYGPTLLTENPEAGEQFMSAYLRAVRQYNDGKTERNLEILAEYTELETEFLAALCWPHIRDSGDINLQSILNFQEWAISKELLDTPVSEEQLWTSQFIEQAAD